MAWGASDATSSRERVSDLERMVSRRSNLFDEVDEAAAAAADRFGAIADMLSSVIVGGAVLEYLCRFYVPFLLPRALEKLARRRRLVIFSLSSVHQQHEGDCSPTSRPMRQPNWFEVLGGACIIGLCRKDGVGGRTELWGSCAAQGDMKGRR